jgi:hypothetical protein
MSKASRRYYRTLILGLAALGVMVWTAVDQFGISRQEMTALLFGTLWIGLRKLLKQGDAE